MSHRGAAGYLPDHTLAEIKTVRAVNPLASGDQSFNGPYEIPTLDEVIAPAKSRSASLGRTIGIYPEVKHSAYHQGLGLTMEDALMNKLRAKYGNGCNATALIQSFEVGNVQYLNSRTDIRLVQIVDADDVNPDGSTSLPALRIPYRRSVGSICAPQTGRYPRLSGTITDGAQTGPSPRHPQRDAARPPS